MLTEATGAPVEIVYSLSSFEQKIEVTSVTWSTGDKDL